MMLEFSWDEFIASARSCFFCDVLIRGARGCFRHHKLEESRVLHCSVNFYYQGWIGEVADIDKELRFLMKDGQRFEVQLFATEGRKYAMVIEVAYSCSANTAPHR
jgi:hypothetical protein